MHETAEGVLALDRNPLRLGRLALGQAQFENAIMVGRLHVFLIHQRGQHEGALEGAVGALDAMVPVGSYLRRRFALAPQHQGVLVDLNADGIFGDPGQVGR